MDALERLRTGCAMVADRAKQVRVEAGAIPAYAASLPGGGWADEADPHLRSGSREERAAFWLTLDAINFGSGWFPTLRKALGRSGYFTIAAGIREHGPWSASGLETLTGGDLAASLGQDPDHELMELFAASLNDLGRHVRHEFGGRFTAVVDAVDGSAASLVEMLAGWGCFADTSSYEGLELPFLKRAQIAAADLQRADVLRAYDLDRLTMFADNLVPHVLRIDGVLSFEPELVERIDHEELIEHDSPEEIEIRACAVHAVELIVAELPGSRASDVDRLLWNRGQGSAYKSRPRHRTRCTAY
jgi:putative queuosine salvage protein